MSNPRLASLVSCFAALSLLVSGCLVPSGSPGGDSAVAGDSVAALAAFRSGYVAASCEWSTRCCNTADIENAFGIPPTDARSCEDVFGPDMDLIIARSTLSVRSGGIAFSPDAAAACVAHIRALPCGTDPESLPSNGPCAGVLVGTRLPGDDCSSSFECSSAEGVNYCRENICTIAFQPTGPLGTACSSGYDCDFGTYCFDGRCRSGAPVGAECGAGLLECAGAICDHGICPPPHADGSHCSRSDECSSGFCSGQNECEQPRCDGIE